MTRSARFLLWNVFGRGVLSDSCLLKPQNTPLDEFECHAAPTERWQSSPLLPVKALLDSRGVKTANVFVVMRRAEDDWAKFFFY